MAKATAKDRLVKTGGVKARGDVNAPEPSKDKRSERFEFEAAETVGGQERRMCSKLPEAGYEMIDMKGRRIVIGWVVRIVHTPRARLHQGFEGSGLEERLGKELTKIAFAKAIEQALYVDARGVDHAGKAAAVDRKKHTSTEVSARMAS
jgi:hypothetical protein